MPKKATERTAGMGGRRGGAAKGKGAKPAAGVEAGRPAEIAVSEEVVATATLIAPTHEQIASRARVIWEKRGCPRGQDEQIWLEAEKQLRQEAERS